MARKGPRHLIKVGSMYYYRRKVPPALCAVAGKKYYKEPLCTDRREAERMRDKRDQEVEDALRNPDASTLLQDFVTRRWLPERASVRDLKGQKLARVRLEKHVFPLLGHVPLGGIRNDQIRALANDLLDPKRKRPLSVQTVKHIMADLRCVLRYAQLDCEILDRVPSFGKLLPVMDDPIPDPLSEEEIRLLLAVATPRESIVLELASYTGMRMAEIDRAHRRDVVLTGGSCSIFIPKAKSHKPRRIPLMPYIAERLRWWFNQDDSVLVSPLRYREMAGLFRRLCRRTEVTGHFHQLRHTFGCRWLAAGGTILSLKEAMGHSDIKLTERYARLTDSFVASEAFRISEWFAKVDPNVDPGLLRAVEK